MFRPASLGQGHSSPARQSRRPADGRRSNLALILRSLYSEPLQTRADLARATGLTRVTISDLVTQLLDEGLVAEKGMTEATRPGKPGAQLAIDDDSRDIIAVDLSAPGKLIGGVFSMRGVRHAERVSELENASGQTAIEETIALVDNLLNDAKHPVLGVAVGTPGIVNSNGDVVSAPNLGWNDVALRQILEERFDTDIIVDNDANVAVLGERAFGDGPDNMIRVQIQRGVGAGVLIGGNVVAGVHNAAGEIGHVQMEPDGPECSCGKRGCLEALLAIPYLKKRISAEPQNREAILAEAGVRLATALVPVVGMLDIAEIILGGPPEYIGGTFLDAAQRVLSERTATDFRGEIAVRTTTITNQAVLLGAVALVMRTTLGVL